jgi:hypothetical protein
VTYPFVQARYDYGARTRPTRAFLVHMAEGGGTVGYLSRDPARGVSVHYVIEYSGRIVQMLREDHSSGSVNPGDIRTTDDKDGFYGVTAAKAVMGAEWSDPNLAVISCEIEGFAAAGPSPVQSTALRKLVNDVRTRYPAIGLLGHRDFADYKACPGRRIDWTALGGHGQGEDMAEITIEFTGGPIPFIADDADNGAASWAADPPHAVLSRVKKLDVIGTVYIPDGTPHGRFVLFATGTTGRRIAAAKDVAPVPLPPPVVDCDDVVKVELEAAAVRVVTRP